MIKLQRYLHIEMSTALVFLSMISYLEAARILAIYPIPSISHQNAFSLLTLELLKKGHQVTALTTDPIFPKGEAPANLTEIDVHDMSYKIWIDILKKSNADNNDMPGQVAAIYNGVHKIADAQFENEEVKDIINNRRNDFDLLLIQNCVRPHLAFTHIIKVPVIQISSFGNWIWNYEIVGAPSHPIWYPTSTNQRSYNLTLWEKILEVLNEITIKYITYITEEEDLKMMRKHFGKDLPGFKELKGNVDMLFLNLHPIWENNRPVPTSVVFMGGIHQKPPQQLPEELKSYLDSSEYGVIYMSFGTNTKSSMLPFDTIQVFIKVFSKLRYQVIWKWDRDDLSGRRHPKVKLFICQGGLQSTDEAITAGVPMIGIPMRVDQWFNVENYVRFGIGVKLDIRTVTEDNLMGAINDIIKNDSYAKNVVKLREIITDQPQRPLDRAVWWIEHVIRHKSAKHLRTPCANMSLIEYLDTQLITVLALIILLLIILTFLIVKILHKINFKILRNIIKIKNE